VNELDDRVAVELLYVCDSCGKAYDRHRHVTGPDGRSDWVDCRCGLRRLALVVSIDEPGGERWVGTLRRLGWTSRAPAA
jgi:DNA-directed RNA polymerase subunit RPC12/RpoP